jgi:hypothetical protein
VDVTRAGRIAAKSADGRSLLGRERPEVAAESSFGRPPMSRPRSASAAP